MTNRFINMNKLIKLGEPSLSQARQHGLIDLVVRSTGDKRLRSLEGRSFVNMCDCSYLGLHDHPKILEGAIDGLRRVGSLLLSTSRMRMQPDLLRDVETALSAHFACHATVFPSCASASSAFLPVLASGALTRDCKPTIIFDKTAHFSMNQVKPVCGDETEVVTCPHDDLNFIEDLCKKRSLVAYVADGTHSISGHASVKELVALQERFGLFLFFDDSHGLSITGKRGEGYVRERIPMLGERTIVVASLGKAFGACGGILMSGSPDTHTFLARYGNAWSQYLNAAGLGGVLGSLAIHQSDELGHRQRAWRANLQLLDDRIAGQNHGSESPIRVVNLKTPDLAVKLAEAVLERGFYTSAVFFPIVARGTAGLRMMPRSNLDAEDVERLCSVVIDVCKSEILPG